MTHTIRCDADRADKEFLDALFSSMGMIEAIGSEDIAALTSFSSDSSSYRGIVSPSIIVDRAADNLLAPSLVRQSRSRFRDLVSFLSSISG